jgi:hypothetical protein
MRTIRTIGAQADLREMMLAAGIGNYNAAMGIQFMNFLPTTTDPYAQGTILIVRGLQRLLNKRGAGLAVDGGMGKATVRALVKYAGPRWYDKSWSQLYGDIMDGRVWDGWDRVGRANDDRNSLEGLGMTRFSSDSHALGHTAYHHLGADTATGVPYYCSVATPQGGCTPVAGVAKPMNAATLVVFQELQQAVNALLAAKNRAGANFELVDVDGRIGPGTVAALKILKGLPDIASTIGLFGVSIDSEIVARMSLTLRGYLFAAMAATGAQLVPNPTPKSPPSVPGPGGSVINPPNSEISGGITALLGNPLAVAAFAVGGLLLFSGSKRARKKGR